MKMKKILAVLAASSVAVSMLAFTGCGSKEPEGAIEGDYTEKTDEEMTEILNNIDIDKVVGGDNSGSGESSGNGGSTTPTETIAAMNLGIAVDLTASYSTGDTVRGDYSIKMDYKEAFKDSKPIGMGTATVKTNSYLKIDIPDLPSEITSSTDLTGTLYNDNDWAYGELKGTVTSTSVGSETEEDDFTANLKKGIYAKVNLEKLVEVLGAGSFAPVSFYEAESAFDAATLLEMAKLYGVKVTADDSDGIKLKISADESTVWTAATQILITDGASPEQAAEAITTYKKSVTFNAFNLNVYFAVDKDGKFAGASVVTDIDVKVDSSLFQELDDAAQPKTEMAIKVKGSVKIYTHSDKVEIPESVTTDKKYEDMTDNVLGYISKMN